VGDSEFGMRFLSVLASLLSVALTFALGKRLYGAGIGVLAAGFVALNTFSITYAQEARMYALLTLWAAAAFWAFVLFIQSPRWRRGLALAVLNGAGLYTHYAFPFVMLAQGVLFVGWMFASYRDIPRYLPRYIVCNLLTLALLLPLLPTAWRQITTWPTTGISIPAETALATILGYFAFGITAGTGITIAVAFFLVFALVQLPDDMRPLQAWRVAVPVVWVMASIGAFLWLDLFREPNLKFLLPAQIGFALWMARGVSVLWYIPTREKTGFVSYIPKAAAIMGTLYLFVTLIETLPPLYTDSAYQRDDYRGIVATIEANLRPDDAIILNAPGQIEVFDYYYRGDAAVYPIPRGYGGDDAATLAELEQIIATHDTIYAVLWGTNERDPNHVVESTLDAQTYPIDSVWYGDVRLARYVTPSDFPEPTEVSVSFGDAETQITLVAYALDNDDLQAGDGVQLQLVWQTEQELSTRYKVFVQLLDANGMLVLQRDSEPAGDSLPTTAWRPNQIIVDNHALLIPADLPPSHYSLIIGLYNLNDAFDRLTVSDGADFYTVATLRIQEP
jgi:mannosyltransferase